MATWHVINNKLVHDDLPEPLTGKYISEPYPPFIWYVNNNKLTTSNMPPVVPQGAFCNCTSLTKATISPTVKYIGEYAFYNTALRQVRIASDCVYYPTSFPPNCEIKFYNQEE